MKNQDEIIKKLSEVRQVQSKDDFNQLAHAWVSALEWVLEL